MAIEKVITIATKGAGKNGGWKLADTLGNKYLVGIKNEALGECLVVGRASMVELAPYKDSFYINKAELFDGKPPEEKQVEKVTAGVEKPQATKEPNPQAVGMITKEIGDMIRTNTLSIIFGSKIANSLLVWYRGQTLGITRIDFDGKDLPKFK